MKEAIKGFLAGLLVLGLVFGIVTATSAAKPDTAPNNGNSHSKATGTVTWTARTSRPPEEQLPGIVSSFEVHVGAPGTEPVRGTYQTIRPADDSFAGGSLSLNVECAAIEGNEAWFAGTVTSATGGYSGNVGDVYLYWVQDNGTPGSVGPDKIGGNPYSTLPQACGQLGIWRGSGLVTDGNLVVHSDEPEITTSAEIQTLSQSIDKGFSEHGYNYNARVFNGTGLDWCIEKLGITDPEACNEELGGPYSNDRLVMKWSKAWDDARFHDADWSPEAWEDNEWNGAIPGGSGEVWHYKIIWVGPGLEDSPNWREGGYAIWGEFEVIMDQGTADGGHFWYAKGIPNGYGVTP